MNRDWILTIGIEKYSLTKEEADFYMESVKKGSKFVELGGGRVFGTNFQALTHKNALRGMWECRKKIWHEKTAECFCEGEWIVENNKAKFIEDKEFKQIIDKYE